MERVNLDGEEIIPLTICLIGGGGFIGSHLCEKLKADTSHKAIVFDTYSDRINHLLDQSCPWRDRIEFHKINITNNSRFETPIKVSDLVIWTINLDAIFSPYQFKWKPLDTIRGNFLDAIQVYCIESKKRLIHFSTCEVYGKTVSSFLPEDRDLRQDPKFYLLKEDASPCIFGPVNKKDRWSYACAQQMMERLIYEEAEHGLAFTIVRPFNWIGPRMDFIPGVDGDKVRGVLDGFSNDLMSGEPLKLVDGGKSQRTFCYIKDAIEAVLLMIENPERANGQIFNVGNPDNEVTVKQFAEMVYVKVAGKSAPSSSTKDVSSKVFYGEGYDDNDKRIPDMTIISRQLGWKPKTSLQDLLEITLSYQHQKCINSQKIKKKLSNPWC